MLTRKYIYRVAIFLIIVSLLSSLYLDYSRVKAEQSNKNVDIVADYDELLALSKAQNIPLDSLLTRFREAGMSGIGIRERSVKDLSDDGEIMVKTANELRLLRTSNPDFLPGLALQDGFTYLIFGNESEYQYILKQLKVKKNNAVGAKNGELYTIAVHLTTTEYEKLGVGFPPGEFAALQNSNLRVVPRLRDWGKFTPDTELFQQTIRQLPNVSLITFNDDVIPAIDNLPGLAQAISTLNVPVGTFEFFNQKGLTQLGYLLAKNVVRVHTISENDMATTTPAAAVDRYRLAVSERNIRVLYVRLFGMKNPDTALEGSLSFIRQVAAGVEAEGYHVNQAVSFTSLPYSRLLLLAIGLGVIGAALLLAGALFNTRWTLILGVLGLVGWVGLLYLSPSLARKGFALLAVILFPLLGMLTVLREERRSLGQSVLELLKMSVISLAGAVIMTGLLADKSFMLKLDAFSGVKLAHIAPIALLLLFLLIRESQPWTKIKRLANAPVLVIHVLIGIIALAALAIYVIRTGNEGTFLVSSWEARIRDILDRVMGVRPRTKEFLLGHPLMLVVLYYGFDWRKTILLVFGFIGQVSLVNTYAHIHTPLLISLTRSFHGLWIGIIIGLILIWVLNHALKWYAKEAER